MYHINYFDSLQWLLKIIKFSFLL